MHPSFGSEGSRGLGWSGFQHLGLSLLWVNDHKTHNPPTKCCPCLMQKHPIKENDAARCSAVSKMSMRLWLPVKLQPHNRQLLPVSARMHRGSVCATGCTGAACVPQDAQGQHVCHRMHRGSVCATGCTGAACVPQDAQGQRVCHRMQRSSEYSSLAMWLASWHSLANLLNRAPEIPGPSLFSPLAGPTSIHFCTAHWGFYWSTAHWGFYCACVLLWHICVCACGICVCACSCGICVCVLLWHMRLVPTFGLNMPQYKTYASAHLLSTSEPPLDLANSSTWPC